MMITGCSGGVRMGLSVDGELVGVGIHGDADVIGVLIQGNSNVS